MSDQNNQNDLGPSFGERHKGIIWALVIFCVIFGSLFAAAISLMR